MSFISNFFIKCSGANREILAEVPRNYLETEKTKFVGIGGTIFFTACLAFVSSSFALYTFVNDITVGEIIIDKLMICISFGMIWAFMIFNLDRYIVSSMRKEGSWKNQLIRAFPRILIAVLFAVVISKPLELEIFRTEIEAQLPQSANNQTAYIQEVIDSLSNELGRLRNESDTLRKNPFDSQFVKFAIDEFEAATSTQDSLSKSLSPEIKEINNRINDLTIVKNAADNRIQQYNKRIKDLTQEVNDTSTAVYDEYNKRQEIEKLKVERWKDKLVRNSASDELPSLIKQRKTLQSLLHSTQIVVDKTYQELEKEKKEVGTMVKEKIAKNNLTILEIEKKIIDQEAERKTLNDKFTGLLARLKALDDLKSAEGNFVILIASTLVFLIFMAIETAPVFVKLMSKRTIYDQILEHYEIPIHNKEFLSERINGFFKEDARLIKKKKKILRNFYSNKLALQEHFLNKSLSRIKENETEKFKNNLDEYSSYISENPDTYLQTFKSNSSPIIRKDGKLVWENDVVLKRNYFGWLSWKYASLFGLGLALITATFLGVKHFTNKYPSKTETVKQEIPVEEKLIKESRNKKDVQIRDISDEQAPSEEYDSQIKSDAIQIKNTPILETLTKILTSKNTSSSKNEDTKRLIANSTNTSKPNNQLAQKNEPEPTIQNQNATQTYGEKIVSPEVISSSVVSEIELQTTEDNLTSSSDSATLRPVISNKSPELGSVHRILRDTIKEQESKSSEESKILNQDFIIDETSNMKLISPQSNIDTLPPKIQEKQKNSTKTKNRMILPSEENGN